MAPKTYSKFFLEYSERWLESTSIQSCTGVLLSSLSVEEHETMHVRAEIPVESTGTPLGLSINDSKEKCDSLAGEE